MSDLLVGEVELKRLVEYEFVNAGFCRGSPMLCSLAFVRQVDFHIHIYENIGHSMLYVLRVCVCVCAYTRGLNF